jgi:hypothetical protein
VNVAAPDESKSLASPAKLAVAWYEPLAAEIAESVQAARPSVPVRAMQDWAPSVSVTVAFAIAACGSAPTSVRVAASVAGSS